MLIKISSIYFFKFNWKYQTAMSCVVFYVYLKEKWRWLGGSVDWMSNFDSGHDLTVHEFDLVSALCYQHRACLGFSLSLSLCPSPAMLSLSKKIFKKISKRNKNVAVLLYDVDHWKLQFYNLFKFVIQSFHSIPW